MNIAPFFYPVSQKTGNTKAPVITVSGSGANAGFTRLYQEDVFASDCSYIDKNTTEKLYFVYCYLKENMYQLDPSFENSTMNL